MITYEFMWRAMFAYNVIREECSHILRSDISISGHFYSFCAVVGCYKNIQVHFGVIFLMMSIPKTKKDHGEVNAERKDRG